MQDYVDLITGRTLPYNDDEYIRQDAEELILSLGYARDQVAVDFTRRAQCGDQTLKVKADLLIFAAGLPALVMRCARGSLVTREKEALAIARLLFDPWAPLAMVYNQDSAELLDTKSGKVIAGGREALPGPDELARLAGQAEPHSPDPDELRLAWRVYHTFSFIHCPGKCTA